MSVNWSMLPADMGADLAVCPVPDLDSGLRRVANYMGEKRSKHALKDRVNLVRTLPARAPPRRSCSAGC